MWANGFLGRLALSGVQRLVEPVSYRSMQDKMQIQFLRIQHSPGPVLARWSARRNRPEFYLLIANTVVIVRETIF